MFGQAKSCVGLDIGTYSIEMVELSGSGSKVRVTGFGYEEIPNEEARYESLSRLVQECRLKGRDIASSVSGRNVIVRYVNMRKMSDEELHSAIKFEADKYIPFGIDEVVLDCQRLSGSESVGADEMRVLLVAVKRNIIEEHVGLLRNVGLNPVIVDVDVFALGNAYQIAPPTPLVEGQVTALVDIGSSKTNINVMDGERSLFTREVYVAGGDFSSSLARRLSMNPYEVEQLKREPGEREEEIREAVSSSIDDLGNEVRLSLDFFENEFEKEVTAVKLSGGGSRLIGLSGGLSEIFGKPAESWDPAEKLEVSLSSAADESFHQNSTQATIALGLAARMRRK